MVELDLSILTIVGAAIGIAATYWKGVIKSNKDLSEVKAELKADIAKIREESSPDHIKINMLWRVIEDKIPKLLMKPTHKRMDELLEKFRMKTISEEELAELKPLVEQLFREDSVKDKGQAFNDMLMLTLIDVRLEELKH